MSQINTLASEELQTSEARRESRYDPNLCKTCQKLGYQKPERSRAPYSDCEDHFQKRIRRLLLTGVTIISR